MPEPGQLIIERQPAGDGWHLRLLGELDVATAPGLARQLRELQYSPASCLVLDLRDLSFMDCSGLRVLVAAQRHAGQAQARLEVLCSDGPVQRLLTLTGVDQLLGVSAQSVPAGCAQPARDGGMTRRVENETRRGVAVFTPHGPADSDTVTELQGKVSQAIAGGRRRVIVDLRAVPAISPAISGELAAALRGAGTGDTRLAVVSTDLRLQDALVLSGIDGLELHPTLTDAFTSLVNDTHRRTFARVLAR